MSDLKDYRRDLIFRNEVLRNIFNKNAIVHQYLLTWCYYEEDMVFEEVLIKIINALAIQNEDYFKRLTVSLQMNTDPGLPLFETKEGFYKVGSQPQEMNIISVKAPLKLWPRLIWAKLRGKR